MTGDNPRLQMRADTGRNRLRDVANFREFPSPPPQPPPFPFLLLEGWEISRGTSFYTTARSDDADAPVTSAIDIFIPTENRLPLSSVARENVLSRVEAEVWHVRTARARYPRPFLSLPSFGVVILSTVG